MDLNDEFAPEDAAEAFRKRVADRLHPHTYADWGSDQVDGSLREVVEAVLAEAEAVYIGAIAGTVHKFYGHARIEGIDDVEHWICDRLTDLPEGARVRLTLEQLPDDPDT